MLKNIKAKFDEALKKEQEFTKTPRSSEETRAHNKKAGRAILLIGVFLVLVNLYLIYYQELISVYFAVAAIFCVVAGIYIVMTGKMPKR